MPPKMHSAIAHTRPVFSHLETEWLLGIIFRSNHPRADYLAEKLVTSTDQPEAYAKLLKRVRARTEEGS